MRTPECCKSARACARISSRLSIIGSQRGRRHLATVVTRFTTEDTEDTEHSTLCKIGKPSRAQSQILRSSNPEILKFRIQVDRSPCHDGGCHAAAQAPA